MHLVPLPLTRMEAAQGKPNLDWIEMGITMKHLAFLLVLIFMIGGCGKQQATKTSASAAPATALAAPVSGPFTDSEVQKFAALDPIDTHTHVEQSDPAFFAMLKRLNLHVLDILVDDDTEPAESNFPKNAENAWKFIHGSDGYAVLCTTFNPFKFNQPDFSQNAIQQINKDFSQGAIAVKIWKNVGMELKDAKGNYVMPDNPAFEPIFKDIAAHNKTLIAHLADPDTIWQAPNPAAPDYSYYMQHRALFMYGKPNAPSKPEILKARDRILQNNPDLRVVGAHLGSMEADFTQLSQHLDQYPNFAVDLAARMDYFEMQPRADIIAFITKYQDRLIYGTDSYFYPGQNAQDAVKDWEDRHANDWRFLATNDTILYRGRKVQGLALPQPILRKIYHDNAVKWFPGILGSSH